MDDRSLRGSGPAGGQNRRRSRKHVTKRFSSAVLISAAGLALLATLLLSAATGAQASGGTPIYLNPSYTFGERAADLVARLTPAQRASQMVSSQAPTITNVMNPLLSPSQFLSATTLAAPASVGDTNVKVASVTNIAAGVSITIDPTGTPETVTVSGTPGAPATATTLPAGASVGDTNIKVASVTGMTVGHTVRIDTGANIEFGTIAAGGVGTAAATATTLAAAASSGATNIKVTSITGMTAGHTVRIDTGANLEIVTIAAGGVGTAGAGGSGITLVAPGLALAHASGAAAQDLGTGVTLTNPLASAHAVGAAAQDLGAGVTFSPALSSAHALGATVNVLTGIPAYGWWNEALHGINAESTATSGNAVTLTNTTSYPIDLSRGASWDPDLLYKVAQAESDEAREVVRQNKLDLDFYSPTMNLARDPRWGRNDESYGEDPLLEAKLASQFVDGMEGKDQSGQLLPAGNGFYKTTTTLKHYVMNNSEGTSNSDPNGRLNGSDDADDRTIREYYTKAFGMVAQAAQPGAIMSSYNEVNGTPAPADTYIMDTIMRQTFGFQGYFTGDCDTVNEINQRHHWQPPGLGHIATVFEQFAYTLGAGEDAECNAGYNGTGNYRGPTAPSTTSGGALTAAGMQIPTATGTMNQNTIDTSATRLFTNRMKLGEFNPDSSVPWLTQAQSRLQGYGVFPYSNTTAPTETAARLALARQSADASIVLLKNASTTRKDGSTGKLLPMVVPPTGSFKVDVMGYFANNANFYEGGYSSIQGTAGQANEVGFYTGLKNAIQAINPAAVVDYNKGFTSTGTNSNTCCTTIDSTAVNNAANYDYVIVIAGGDGTVGCAQCGTEDQDRSSILLSGQQGQLISQVSQKNPNTVAFMETIGANDISSFEPTTSAILWSSYLGERKGESLGDVLLGTYNPSGRTPQTWYQNVSQIPSIYSYAIRPVGPTGRTYMYYNGPVSYPFGYGLSYTSFGFSNMQIDNHNPTADDTINVSVDVTNSGSADGNEIVQLYANTPNADPSLQRPIKRLEGFQKVLLAAGQTKTLTFPLKISDLAFWNTADNRWEVDQGVYGIQISTSSADADIQQQDTINVSGNITPKPNVLTAKPRIMTTDVARGITQRVIFPENVDIDPGLTVSMNDASLYGWIEPGSSVPFPSGATFSYSSDHPDVVSVSGGTIHTVGNGAATVTATITYNGVSKSTSFVVRVISELDSISYDGTPVPGFNPTVTSYDVILPSGASTPNVTATAPSANVAITQASGVPGTATITATGPEGIATTYKVNFAVAASNDEFNGTSLDPRWSVVRQDGNLSVGGGSLTITPEAGQLTTNNATTAKNLVLEPAFGDFTETTKVTFNQKPNAATQQAGLLAYQDDDNYFKFDVEATSATNIQLNTSMEDSFQTDPVNSASPIQVNQTLNTTALNSTWPANNTIWLRLHRHGSTFTTYYSLDGTTWTTVWSNGATLSNVRVGPYAYSAAAAAGPLTASFDFFHVNNQAGAPVTTATYAPPAVNGWFNQNPTVTLTAQDNSGIGIQSTTYTVDGGPAHTYTAPFTISGEGTHTLTYSSTDNDGTVEATKTDTVKIDTIAPTVSAALTPAAVGGYYSNPTVTITSSDAGSGVALTEYNLDGAGWQIYTLPFQVTGDGSHTVQYRATDTAGNVTTSSTTFQNDGTAPTTGSTAPCSSPGSNGWCLVAVQVTLLPSDATSGVASTQYRIDGGSWTPYISAFTISADGDHLVEFASTDNAGNVEATKSIHVKVDQTNPVSTLAISPAEQNGWYASPSITLTATDGTGSGVAMIQYSLDGGPWTTYSAALSGFSTGNHVIQYRATDNAGRVEAAHTFGFKVDAVKPSVNIVTPADGDSFPLNKVVTAKFKCNDNESGVATCVGTVANGANLDTSTIGSHAFTVTGTDKAGNVTTVTTHYTVTYTWDGFFSPITNSEDSGLNLVHAGDLIKLGFGLNGDRGTNIFAAGSPSSTTVACPSWPPHTVPAGGAGTTAGLSYGVASGHYTYGWQTDPAWAGTCRRFDLQLNDGTAAHSATFMFFS